MCSFHKMAKLYYWPKLIGHYDINSQKTIKNTFLLKNFKIQLFDEGI